MVIFMRCELKKKTPCIMIKNVAGNFFGSAHIIELENQVF